MHAESISLENYRNIHQEKVSFSPCVNFLFGDNAQGKTNILEALYFYARGKSFRGSTDKEQTAFGCDYYETILTFSDAQRQQELSYRYCMGDRIRKRNGMTVTRPIDMLGHFRCVLFFPENLQMVKGGPEERRAFLNIAVSQCIPSYLSEYALYKHTLDQRNALLKTMQKTGTGDENQLDAWSDALAAFAAKLHVMRREYIDILSPYTAEFMSELSEGREKISLSYESSLPEEQGHSTQDELYRMYLRALTENRQREVLLGYTLYGIHRDDMALHINGRAARLYASQGQQRSFVLCMKLAEGEACRRLSGEYPVYLFDDVLSELDEGRRRYVLQGMQDRQMIMTGCEKTLFDSQFLSSDNVNMIQVFGGHYVPAHR